MLLPSSRRFSRSFPEPLRLPRHANAVSNPSKSARLARFTDSLPFSAAVQRTPLRSSMAPAEPEMEDHLLQAGDHGVIEPQVLHEVAPVGKVTFFVEFHRAP